MKEGRLGLYRCVSEKPKRIKAFESDINGESK